MSEYSFCETITASGRTPWHIRKLTKAGRKLGGGADTLALCGRKVAWDRDIMVTYANRGCELCWSRYAEIQNGGAAMSDTPDLDRAREVARVVASHHLSRRPTIDEVARLILEQRAEEAERNVPICKDYGCGELGETCWACSRDAKRAKRLRAQIGKS